MPLVRQHCPPGTPFILQICCAQNVAQCFSAYPVFIFTYVLHTNNRCRSLSSNPGQNLQLLSGSTSSLTYRFLSTLRILIPNLTPTRQSLKAFCVTQSRYISAFEAVFTVMIETTTHIQTNNYPVLEIHIRQSLSEGSNEMLLINYILCQPRITQTYFVQK